MGFLLRFEEGRKDEGSRRRMWWIKRSCAARLEKSEGVEREPRDGRAEALTRQGVSFAGECSGECEGSPVVL